MAVQKNRSVLIIGGSSGIGLSLARRLHSEGATVIVASRHQNAVLESLGIQHISLDILSDDDKLTNQLPDVLHGLAYCPGSITLKPFARLKREDFLQDFDINVWGAVKSIQAVYPALRKSKDASILLFSTVASRAGMSFHASIAASKSAVEGLALSLAAEFSAAKIRVNVIAPSITQTPLASQLLSSEDKITASANRHPIKRIGDPDEIAALGSHLLSGESGWITGQVIAVDGGLANLRPL